MPAIHRRLLSRGDRGGRGTRWMIVAVFACASASWVGCSRQSAAPVSGSASTGNEPADPPKKLSTIDDAKSNQALEFAPDDMTQVTWFNARNHERSYKKLQWSSVKAYFAWLGKTSSFGPLRMKATYHGDRWAFARQLIIKIDENEPVIFDIQGYRRSSVSDGVWEYYDAPLDEKHDCFDRGYSRYESDVCKVKRMSPNLETFCSPQMLSAAKVKVRFDGDRAFTFDLPRNQLDDLKAACGAYLALAR